MNAIAAPLADEARQIAINTVCAELQRLGVEHRTGIFAPDNTHDVAVVYLPSELEPLILFTFTDECYLSNGDASISIDVLEIAACRRDQMLRASPNTVTTRRFVQCRVGNVRDCASVVADIVQAVFEAWPETRPCTPFK
jgi:hypothetical protein